MIKNMRKPLVSAIALASIGFGEFTVANEGWAIEEIVVTAQKREQNLNDVGVAVSAFSGETMKDLGLNDATDIAAQTPGFTVTNAGGGGIPVYTIRGVGFDDFSINSSSTVGLYVDEIAKPYPVMTRGVQFDVERVEVLKGPQGDLYGRNNTGGAINIIAAKPTEDFEAGVTLGYGRYDTTTLDGFVSGSLSDSVNARLAISSTNIAEGSQKNVINGERHGQSESYAVRAMLDWAASDDVSVLFTVHGTKEQADTQVPQSFTPTSALYTTGLPTTQPDLSDNNSISTNAGRNAPGRTETTAGASVHVNWEMDSVTLTSITAYDKFDRLELNDWDGTEIADGESTSDATIDSWSQELRLSSSDSETLSWIGGLYFSSDEVKDNSYSNALDSFFLDSNAVVDQTTDTMGVYGHAEWNISEQFRLVTGVRYTHEEREVDLCTADSGNGYLSGFQNGMDGAQVNVVGDFSVAGGCAHWNVLSTTGGIPNVTAGVFSDEITTEKVTGKIGLDYMPNDDWLIYASVSNGFKSGGFNAFSGFFSTQFEPYSEEELTAYEIGFKATLLDSTMQLNGAVFRYDYKDKQLSEFTVDPTGLFGLLTKLKNIPKSEVDGAELELQWRPLQGLDVRLATTYLNATVTDFDTGFDFGTGTDTADFSGAELPNTPQWSYNAMVSYETEISDGLLIRFVTDYMHTDQYYSYTSNIDGTDLVEDYGVLNARLILESTEGDWSASLWGKNLEDKYYYVSNSFVAQGSVRFAGQGATYGVTVSYNF